jgi:glycerol-3-phosphate acyltransferase PlsY
MLGGLPEKKIAVITELLDMFKGFLPVAVYLYFIDDKKIGSEFHVYCVALATIIGHDFSIFLKLKGERA